MAVATSVVHVANIRGPVGPTGPAGPGWPRGVLANFTNVDTLVGKANEGVWSIIGKSSAESMRGLPPEIATADLWPGTFHVIATTAGTTEQEYRPYGGGNAYWIRSSANADSSVWLPWNMVLRRGDNPVVTIADGTDLNSLTKYLDGQVKTSGAAASMLNTPGDGNPFFLMVRPMIGQAIIMQMLVSFGSGGGFYYRITTSVSSGNFTPWRNLWSSSGSGGTSTVPAFKHSDLLSRAKARRHGALGTGGLPVVALRFDHHLEPFRDKILPLLIERKLPFALALNPERTANTTVDDNVPWATIQSWCIQNGGEVWNHGGNHGDATTELQLVNQIVTSLASLETNLPALAIEGFAPPGLPDGQYMGASPFKTVAQNSGTYAGQLITGNHAFVAGYAQGVYRTLDGEGIIGAPHVTMDKTSLSSIVSALNAVESNAEGVALMLHPNYLDQTDYISTATFTAILDEIVARRDAGQLEVLSYSGLWLAESGSMQRSSLVKISAPFTLSSAFSTSWSVYRREHLLGGMREVRAQVTGTGTHTVTVAGGAVNVTVSLSGAGLVRLPFTIPLDQSDSLVFTVSSTNAAAVLDSFEVVAI